MLISSSLSGKLRALWPEVLIVIGGFTVAYFLDEIGWTAALVIWIALIAVGLVLWGSKGDGLLARLRRVGRKPQLMMETQLIVGSSDNYGFVDFHADEGWKLRVSARGSDDFAVRFLDEVEYRKFEKNKEFRALAGIDRTTYFSQIVEIPFSGRWYIVIEPEKSHASPKVEVWRYN